MDLAALTNTKARRFVPNRKQDQITLPESVQCHWTVRWESFDYLSGEPCYSVMRVATGARKYVTRWAGLTAAEVGVLQKFFMDGMEKVSALTASKYCDHLRGAA